MLKAPISLSTRRAAIALTTMALLTIAAVFAGSGSARSQVAPANTVEPRIVGTPVVNRTLTGTRGTWTESPTSYDFQWTRCPASGGAPDASNCAAIGGATTNKYVPANIDVGKRLRVRVTASNADGSRTVATNASVAVKAAGTLANTKPPTISGSATVGSTLTAARGQWSGSEPIAYSYSWRRCDADGGGCVAVADAIDPTYVLKSTDVGSSFRVRVVARDDSGSSAATSVPTAVVRVAGPAANGCSKTGGTVPISGIASPAQLTIDQTQVSPSSITYSTRSLTARFHVAACGGSVEGALVYVTAVPYGQFGIPNEQPTGADGWATLQFNALRGFPVSNKQQLLVMFVRARKNGESLLGGISSRRLVSFRVTHG